MKQLRGADLLDALAAGLRADTLRHMQAATETFDKMEAVTFGNVKPPHGCTAASFTAETVRLAVTADLLSGIAREMRATERKRRRAFGN